MARASGIWVVMPPSLDTELPCAIFTVKHEMVAFLKKKAEVYAPSTFANIEVYRYQDGREAAPETLNACELIGEWWRE